MLRIFYHSLFFESLIIGLAIAAPVGPVSMICMRTTLTQGIKIGFAVGLGAAVADGAYAIIASFSLTVLLKILLKGELILKALACSYLIYLGISFVLKKPNFEIAQQKNLPSFFKTFTSAFIFTLTSPMTILSFASLFASLELNSCKCLSDKIIVVLGVFIGSLSWWGILVKLIGLAHEKLSNNFIRNINRLSGLIILGFALHILLDISIFNLK